MSDTATRANIRPADESAIRDAARALRAGKLVAFPTETVYGLGADATDEAAVARVFEAKQRPRFNPLIVHFPNLEAAESEAVFNDAARALASAFWPGPLTLVLPRTPDCRIAQLVSAGLGTIAVRVPGHVVAQNLFRAAGVPVAAPSANRFGDISPTTAAHVSASLDGAPAVILDGGPPRVGIESTVVDLSGDEPALLRPGGVPVEAIESLIGPLARPGDEAGDAARLSPGRIARHYAPRTPLRLDATEIRPGEVVLAFGADLPPGAEKAPRVLNLSLAGDTTEAAANLFAMLHTLDAQGASCIAAMPVPETGLGAAINDRLRRAAHPGDSGGDTPLPAGRARD